MTRMWMINPRRMCRQHLLGEHKEIHQLIGQLKKKLRVDKYIENNCLEITSIIYRHNQLVNEMKRRGYNHQSPILQSQKEINELASYLPDFQLNYRINLIDSFQELHRRCENCRKEK